MHNYGITTNCIVPSATKTFKLASKRNATIIITPCPHFKLSLPSLQTLSTLPWAPPPDQPAAASSASPLRSLLDHPNPQISAFPHSGFSHVSTPITARALHCLSITHPFHLSTFHRNTLIAAYLKFGNPDDALNVFDTMPQRNDASWNNVISGLVKARMHAESAWLFRKMRREGFRPNGFVLASLVTGCNLAEVGVGIHCLVTKLGLMSNVYVGTALLHLYGRCGLVEDAGRFFGEMPERNVVSWTALMASFAANGHPEEAVRAYRDMRREGVVCNQNSFATVISSCAMLENDTLSMSVLRHVVTSGHEAEVSVANSLIALLGNMGRIADAEHLFRRVEEKDIISWNSMISAYAHEGMQEKSCQCFSEMRRLYHKLRPDSTTLSSLIVACSSFDYANWGRGMHALAIKYGLDSFVAVCNTLINMYSALGDSGDAEVVFDAMPERDVISWNSLMSSYVQSGEHITALRHFVRLLGSVEQPSYVTFASALGACSSSEALLFGKAIHALIVQYGLLHNLLLANALITMYGKCNAMRDAGYVFTTMPYHDVVSWNTLIGGHVDNEEQTEAMEVFIKMREYGSNANYITMVNILGVCVQKDVIKYVMPLHSLVISTGFESDEFVMNSLINAYANCGDFDSSGYMFDRLVNKSAVSWNVMISAKAHHGRGEDALRSFIGMQHAGIELDRFSLVGGLAATASLAALEEGQQLHGLITKLGFDNNLEVTNAAMDMYGKCGELVDVLKLLPEPEKRSRISWNIIISVYARHGFLQKAEDAFKVMLLIGPKPDYVTFVSLLSACSHGGLVEKGLEYYDSMTSEFGISPRIEHCVCMVDLLGRSGRLSEAEKFIHDMPVSPNDLIWRSLLSSCRTHRKLDIGKRAAERLLELAPSDDSGYVLLSNAHALAGNWEDVENLRTRMKSIDLKKKPACSWIKFKNEVNTFGIGDWAHPQAKRIRAKLEELLRMVRSLGYVADTSVSLHDTDEEQIEHNLWEHSEKLALAYGLMTVPEGSAVRVFKNLRVCGDCHLVYKLVSRGVDREIVLRDPYRFHHFKGGTCSCSDYW